jgi:PAS domain S-box-containing protein
MKLIVADQDTATRNLIAQPLADSKIEIVDAPEGGKAWELLSGGDPPRLAILDWNLPGMNGLEICRKVRERASPDYVHITLVGTAAGKPDMLAAFQAGADDYITKPIDGDELVCRIRAGWRILQKEEKLTSIIYGWRTMLDSLPFGVACLGSSGELLRANKIFVELLGHEVHSLLGKSLKQTVLPEERYFSRLMKCIRALEGFDRIEMEMIQHDGAIRNLIVWGRPIPNTREMVFQIIVSLP